MMTPNDAQGINSEYGSLSREQIDIIGEVSNISMGSAATALSNMIGKKVTITSPVVDVANDNTINNIQRIPSVGVIISYTEGIVGKDILVIKQSDADEIVKVLMGGEVPEDDFGEIHISAIAEVMNQMMGSAATALSGFIGKSVNISPPDAFLLTDENKEEKLSFILGNLHNIVFIKFLFQVENMFESDIYMIMTREFTDELVNVMLEKMGITDISQTRAESSEISQTTAVQPAQPAPPISQPPTPPVNQPVDIPQPQPYMDGMGAQTQSQAAAMRAPVMQTAIHRAVLPDFGVQESMTADEQSNFELIQEVPLELSVEVGRSRKLVKEVMDFSVGTIIELDKQAGDPVDIIVNGQLLAHGEVVVIDESFGVRVTEIISNKAKRR